MLSLLITLLDKMQPCLFSHYEKETFALRLESLEVPRLLVVYQWSIKRETSGKNKTGSQQSLYNIVLIIVIIVDCLDRAADWVGLTK